MWQGIHHQGGIIYGSALRHLYHTLPADLFVSSLALVPTTIKPDVRRPWPQLTSNTINPPVVICNFFSGKTCYISVALVIEVLNCCGQKINWKFHFSTPETLLFEKPMTSLMYFHSPGVSNAGISHRNQSHKNKVNDKNTLIILSHRLSKRKCKVNLTLCNHSNTSHLHILYKYTSLCITVNTITGISVFHYSMKEGIWHIELKPGIVKQIYIFILYIYIQHTYCFSLHSIHI